jgi:DNA replication protein DnaC
MDEGDFAKLNKRLRKNQAQIAKQRQKQSPSKIGETICSIPRNESTGENEPAEKCNRCGKTDCELITSPNGNYKLCVDCEDARKKYVAEQRKRKLEYIRSERRVKRDKHHWVIEQIIPKRYQQARLNQLGKRFKEQLLSYDKTTGLILFGPVGTGKTRAICALLRSLIASGLKCDRIGYEELCLAIRDTYKSKSLSSELDVLNRYRKADVLVIEDLGSSRPIGSAESDFSLRAIYSILDKRLEWQQQTLITTNKTMINLRTSFDERIASRLSMMKSIGVGGKDKRAVGTKS